MNDTQYDAINYPEDLEPINEFSNDPYADDIEHAAHAA